MWSCSSHTTDSVCEISSECMWCFDSPYYISQRDSWNADPSTGPSFEGPHPPTFGPRSIAGSSDETQRNHPDLQQLDEVYLPAECPARRCSLNRSASTDFPSTPCSRRFSRENTETVLDIDEILRDAGCESPPDFDDCSRRRPMPPIIGRCPVLRKCTGVAPNRRADVGDDWVLMSLGLRSPEEELRAAVTRSLSLAAFQNAQADRILDAVAAGCLQDCPEERILLAVRESHMYSPFTARFCQLTRNNGCGDLFALGALVDC